MRLPAVCLCVLQAGSQRDQLQQQILEEQELRAVTEGWLVEDRAAWQQIHRLAADTRQRHTEGLDTLYTLR